MFFEYCPKMFRNVGEIVYELLISDWYEPCGGASQWGPLHGLLTDCKEFLRKMTLFKYLSPRSLIHQIQLSFLHESLFVFLSSFCFLYLSVGLRLSRRSAVTIWRYCWINMAAFLCVGQTPSTRCAPITLWVAP